MQKRDDDAARVARALGMVPSEVTAALRDTLEALPTEEERMAALAEVLIGMGTRRIGPALTRDPEVVQKLVHYGGNIVERLFDIAQQLDAGMLWLYMGGILSGGQGIIARIEDGPDPEEDRIEDHERISPDFLQKLFGADFPRE